MVLVHVEEKDLMKVCKQNHVTPFHLRHCSISVFSDMEQGESDQQMISERRNIFTAWQISQADSIRCDTWNRWNIFLKINYCVKKKKKGGGVGARAGGGKEMKRSQVPSVLATWEQSET